MLVSLFMEEACSEMDGEQQLEGVEPEGQTWSNKVILGDMKTLNHLSELCVT